MKVVCIQRGPWSNAFGIEAPKGVGPVYGEICVVGLVRPPGRYTTTVAGVTYQWDQPVDYYRLAGRPGWWLSERFRPLDEVERLQELVKSAPVEETV